jgi:hypothetical protein
LSDAPKPSPDRRQTGPRPETEGLKASQRPGGGKPPTGPKPQPSPAATQHPKRSESGARPAAAKRPKSALKVRRASVGTAWELVHPVCVQQRAEDLAQVHDMLAAGEIDVARDELLWLLDGCRDFIEAHKLLAELALAENDLRLARAHFGFAFQLGADALPPGDLDPPLSYTLAANQPFLESAKGLAWCLIQLEMPDQAREVLEQLLRCDHSDPLGAEAMLIELSGPGGL